MSKVLRLNGIIRDIYYEPRVRTQPLGRYAIERFDINTARASGIVQFADGTDFGYSKWNTPKASRTYPSARIYRTYHLQTKRVAVIPIIKDEGGGSQNNDRISSMSFARMNLTNVYIILAWYDRAVPHQTRPNRISNQQLNNEFVVEKMREIRRAQKSALHWNTLHFERDFEHVYRQAVESYQKIGSQHSLEMHSAQNHLAILEQYMVGDEFSLDAFVSHSSARSSDAAKREAMTTHNLEQLFDGDKAYFELANLQGGIYHLTADEVYWEDGKVVVQESINTSQGMLPSLIDIQDGLYRNILFYGIDELYLDGRQISFSTRLKLTGNLSGTLMLPDDGESAVDQFADANNLNRSQRQLLNLLFQEAVINPGISIEIASNK